MLKRSTTEVVDGHLVNNVIMKAFATTKQLVMIISIFYDIRSFVEFLRIEIFEFLPLLCSVDMLMVRSLRLLVIIQIQQTCLCLIVLPSAIEALVSNIELVESKENISAMAASKPSKRHWGSNASRLSMAEDCRWTLLFEWVWFQWISINNHEGEMEMLSIMALHRERVKRNSRVVRAVAKSLNHTDYFLDQT